MKDYCFTLQVLMQMYSNSIFSTTHMQNFNEKVELNHSNIFANNIGLKMIEYLLWININAV